VTNGSRTGAASTAVLWLALAASAACGRMGYDPIARSGNDGAAGTGGVTDAGGDPDAIMPGGDGGVLEAGTGSCADAGPPCGALKVQYASANQDKPTGTWIRAHLNVVNNGAENIPLAELTIRYWYTMEAPQPQTWACDYSTTVPCGDFMITFSTIVPARGGASDAFDVGFFPAAGTLAAGGQTQGFGIRVGKSDFSDYSQSDDYSYVPNQSQLTDNPKITLYRNGVLVWGTEPR
jgi:hypothetical protein